MARSCPTDLLFNHNRFINGGLVERATYAPHSVHHDLTPTAGAAESTRSVDDETVSTVHGGKDQVPGTAMARAFDLSDIVAAVKAPQLRSDELCFTLHGGTR